MSRVKTLRFCLFALVLANSNLSAQTVFICEMLGLSTASGCCCHEIHEDLNSDSDQNHGDLDAHSDRGDCCNGEVSLVYEVDKTDLTVTIESGKDPPFFASCTFNHSYETLAYIFVPALEPDWQGRHSKSATYLVTERIRI